MLDHFLCILIRVLVWFSGFARFLAQFGVGHYEEWHEGEKVKLLLVGYNGARNTGADARVVAIVKQLKEIFGTDRIEITVMTLNKQTLEGYFEDDVNLLEFSSIFLLDLFRACCNHHAAILCEGSTLKSTFANALTLFFCEASGIMARQKKPCIAYGSEVGSMDAFLARFAAKMCQDTYFITRTEESQTALTELGLSGHVGTDTAWCYDKAISRDRAEELLIQAGWDQKQPLLGIAVIDAFCWPVRPSLFRWMKGTLTGNHRGQYDKWYFFSDSSTRRAAQDRYLDAIALAVQQFEEYCSETGQTYFPVVIGMERLDETACRILMQKLNQPSALFWSGECSADIMVGILRRLSMLVTSRYHAAVLSMEAEIPIIAVSMDERLDSIFREISLEQNYLFHVDDLNLQWQLSGAMHRAEEERQMIGTKIRIQREAYQKKLNAMGLFLKAYIGGRLL